MTSKTPTLPSPSRKKQVTKDLLSKPVLESLMVKASFAFILLQRLFPLFTKKMDQTKIYILGIGVFILEKGQEKEAKLAIKKPFLWLFHSN